MSHHCFIVTSLICAVFDPTSTGSEMHFPVTSAVMFQKFTFLAKGKVCFDDRETVVNLQLRAY